VWQVHNKNFGHSLAGEKGGVGHSEKALAFVVSAPIDYSFVSGGGFCQK